MKIKIAKVFYSTLAATLIFPMSAFAVTQSGGGYIINGQVNAVPGFVTGGGYSSQVGGNPVSQVITGNGVSSYGGGYFSPPVAVVVIPPSGGGGGGGGGTINPSTTPSTDGGNGGINRSFAEIVAITELGRAPYRADSFPDGVIDILDFNVLMVNWSKKGDTSNNKCSGKILADVNCDGKVDILDFNLLMVYWGKKVGSLAGKILR